MTSVAGPSPSAPIFTTLTIQATRPLPVKEPTRKYPLDADTPELAAVPVSAVEITEVHTLMGAVEQLRWIELGPYPAAAG